VSDPTTPTPSGTHLAEPAFNTVTLLSDLGTADEMVGVVHSVITQLAPTARVIDLTHGIDPFDVRAGSLALARAVSYLPRGVILAAVDPGAGSDRRLIGVAVDGGVLIGPDNGLLAPAVALAEGALSAVELSDPAYHLGAVRPTAVVRDVLAPVAAHLCNGVPLAAFGPEIDTATLFPGLMPVARTEDGALHTEVLWVDRFGNCQLNASLEDVAEFGPVLRGVINQRSRSLRRVSSFAELATGEFGALEDESGLISIVTNRGAASEALELAAGDAVELHAGDPGDDGEASAVITPVELGRRT
jgi:S-adenosylmethionine hydrolase